MWEAASLGMLRNSPGSSPAAPTIPGGRKTKTEVMMLYDKRWEQPTETKRKRKTWRDINQFELYSGEIDITRWNDLLPWDTGAQTVVETMRKVASQK